MNILKVLLEGLYEDPSDPDCSLLSMLRGPRELVMKKIWEYCTSDWQVNIVLGTLTIINFTIVANIIVIDASMHCIMISSMHCND